MPVAGRLSTGGGAVIVLPCKVNVEVGMFVYLDKIEGNVGPANASDEATMPSIGYVQKVRLGKATIIKSIVLNDVVGIAPDHDYYISETHEGKIQTNSPTSNVSQLVATGISEGTAYVNVEESNAVFR